MKKYKFTIQGNTYDVEVLNFEDNIAEIDVNGSTYKVELHQEAQRVTKTPKLVRKVVEPTGDADKAKTSRPVERKGAGLVKAPLPGVILSLHKAVGDSVKVGERILIMEAMKMENNINAHVDGKILSIKVNVGDSVLEGDTLVEIGGN